MGNGGYGHGGRGRRSVPQAVLCGALLVVGAATGLAMFYAGTSGDIGRASADPAALPRRDVARVVVPQVIALQAVALRAAAPVETPPGSARYATMFDPALSTAAAPMRFSSSLSSASIFAPAPARAPAPAPAPAPAEQAEAAPTMSVAVATAAIADRAEAGTVPVAIAEIAPENAVPFVPLPLPRPAGLLSAHADPRTAEAPRRVASLKTMPAPAAAPPTERNFFFDKLFGAGAHPGAPALAYASPDAGLGGFGWGRGDAAIREAAVYNIATHTVTLPDGTRLEAHSGLGSSLDDPRSVAQRMRGVTPPNTYDLTLREAPFHGVRALRLTPTGGTTYGRGGLLAHTFMLGPRGDSNGCVVFRDYAAFLRAYESGAVRRLVVVSGA